MLSKKSGKSIVIAREPLFQKHDFLLCTFRFYRNDLFSGTSFLFCINARAEKIVMFSQGKILIPEKKKKKKKLIPENNIYFFIYTGTLFLVTRLDLY